MLKKIALSHIYALAAWTIKEDDKGRYFVCRTGSNAYGKPYKTLRLACTAIARKLEEEYATRRQRLVEYHGGRR